MIRPSRLPLLLLCLALGACDYFAERDLRPGQSTREEVRQRLGQPNMEWQNADGSITWEFSRQPQGITCYMATLGPDGVLRRFEQVLNESNFAAVQPGMSQALVRRMLCQPARAEAFGLKGETVWSWLIDNTRATEKVYFTVSFGPDGKVSKTGRFTDLGGR